MKKLYFLFFIFIQIWIFNSCTSMNRILYRYAPDIQIQSSKLEFTSFRDLTIKKTLRIENKIQFPVKVESISIKISVSGLETIQKIPEFDLQGKEIKTIPIEWKTRLPKESMNQKEIKIQLTGKSIFLIHRLEQIDLKNSKSVEKEFSSTTTGRTPAFPEIKIEKIELQSIDYLGANLNVHILTTNRESYSYNAETPNLQIKNGRFILFEENGTGQSKKDKNSIYTEIPIRAHFIPLGNALLNIFQKGKIKLSLKYTQNLKMDDTTHQYNLSQEKEITLPHLPSIRHIKTDYDFSSIDTINLETTLGIKNHSSSTLKLNQLSYNILLNDEVVLSANPTGNFEISSGEEEKVIIKNAIPLKSFWKGFSVVLKEKDIRIKIKAKTGNINGKIPTFSLPFEKEIQINKPTMPKIYFLSFQYKSKRLYPPSVTFSLEMDITNENLFPLNIDMLRADLLFQNESIANITQQRIKIYPKQTKRLSIPVTITGKDFLNNLEELRSASKDSFQLKGSIVFNAAGIPVRLTFP